MDSATSDLLGGYRRIVVFAAHADDEMTMAGTIARFVASGVEVSVVVMTDGSEGYPSPELRDRIVALRRQEAAACDLVLGIRERVFIGQPDMGLEPSKACLQACIAAIRRLKPEAVFTHGPSDRHGDHRQTHRVSVDAVWHAGEPVSAALGEPWKTPWLYYYKGVSSGLPSVSIDVTDTAHKRWEALATQESQFTLFKSDRRHLLARADDFRRNPQRTRETFWIAETNSLDRFPTI